jgi:hypothetical protein
MREKGFNSLANSRERRILEEKIGIIKKFLKIPKNTDDGYEAQEKIW